ncbi:hypothetical protein [Streptomyces sp. Wb2n-11]|uniref:hypothetical protein n=1 Tax=Streptomyces sp. Wb2n-11 TaxID=1030533 RepID=UPI000A45C973|nr:hypothetical protein [Streptomyces sp. Wb2n-11]
MFKSKRRSVAVVTAGLVLAVGGCGAGADDKSGPSDKGAVEPMPAPPPSKKLVEWIGDMCESTTALKNLRVKSAAVLKEIRNPDEIGSSAEPLAVGYISRTPLSVEDVERDLKDLGPSGVSATDRLLDAWLKKLKDVAHELGKVSPSAAFDDAEGSAADVDKLVQSLTPPKPDLSALTKNDSQLAAAHKRAERCAPGWKPPKETASPAPGSSGPLPKAADGKNTGACVDGACEVLVTSPVSITANGQTVHVTAANESVTFQTPSTVIQLGSPGSVAEFGDDLAVIVIAQHEDGAVLEFTTP